MIFKLSQILTIIKLCKVICFKSIMYRIGLHLDFKYVYIYIYIYAYVTICIWICIYMYVMCTYIYTFIYNIYIYICFDNILNKKTVDYYQNFTWDVLHILQEIIARSASSSVFKQVNVLVVEFWEVDCTCKSNKRYINVT